MENSPFLPMPRYRCHKEVRAMKIATVEVVKTVEDDEVSHGILWPVNHHHDRIRVSAAYLKKHEPEPGGYYVLYQDGYESWSPAGAFQEGYTLIG